MDRIEFLDALRETLQGEIPEYEISGHIQYYDNYIRENGAEGETERLASLGDPRLIARTIIDARMSKEGTEYYSYENSYEQGYDDNRSQAEESEKGQIHYYSWDNLKWYQKLLVVFVLILVLLVLVAVAGVGIHIFFRLILPILVIFFVVRLLISLFQ